MFDGLGDLEPAALVGLVETTHREESVLVARRMAAVAELLHHRITAYAQVDQQRQYALIDPFEQVAAEVAAAMNLSPAAASYVVSDAEALDNRLPKVAALLAAGGTDWRTVRLIIARTELVTDHKVITALDESLAARIGRWHGWSRRRIVNAVDAAVKVKDPDAVRERRAGAEDQRRIDISALDNGMAQISGTLAAAAAAAVDRRLSQLATQVCAGDPRTLDQRRADALGALAAGRALTCTCGQTDCPNRSKGADAGGGAGGVHTVINVITTDTTLQRDGAAPGYLEGYGVIEAEQVRRLAAAGASLRLANPLPSPAEEWRYQPSAGLERAVRCRDLTCRFPGCSRRAGICDLDHTVAFNHLNPAAGGLTILENLKCLCRKHHRIKTFGGWLDQQLADGTVIWTSPTGRTYRTSPAGIDLFPALHRPACAAPTRNRRSRAQQRSTRIAAARKHNRDQRPLNEVQRVLATARKQEIAGRKFRNHMRDMLFLFKGEPSNSPFCTWVNDPREPEELPPDWKPPEPEPLPDDPPF